LVGCLQDIHWAYRNRGFVLVKGKRAPLVGNVCMDNTMIDLTHIPEAGVGDHALVFGSDEKGQTLHPTDLAALWNTVPYQLLVALGPRIPRLFIP